MVANDKIAVVANTKHCQTKELSPHQPAAPHPPHPSLSWTRPTKAHEGPQHPRRLTQAHEEETGPKQRQMRRLGPRCVFLKLFFSVLLTTTAPNDVDALFGPFC